VNPQNPLLLPQNSPLRAAEEVFINYFLKRVAPTPESEKRREGIFTQIKGVIENALGGPLAVAVMRYGSDPLKTYLPESDVDITVILKDGTHGSIERSALTQLKLIRTALESYN